MLSLLEPSSRRAVLWLLVAHLIGVFAELLGVAVVFPFILLVGMPDLVQTQPQLNELFVGLGFESTREFLLAVGVTTFVVMALCKLYSAWLYWQTQKFGWNEQGRLARRLLEVYLRCPYAVHLSRGTPNMLGLVGSATFGGILAVLNLSGKALFVLAAVASLLVLDPVIALTSLLLFGGAYVLVFQALRGRLRQSGVSRVEADQLRYKYYAEAMACLREIRLQHSEPWAVDRFWRETSRSARINSCHATVAELPRWAIEILAFGGIIGVILFLLWRGDDLTEIMPRLGVFTVASYRIIAALQQGFSSLTLLQVCLPSVESVYRDLHQPVEPLCEGTGERLTPGREIRLSQVSFRYPDSPAPVLRSVSLCLEVNTTIGFVGATGAGKTTLASLLLGLLQPDSGHIEVDGVPLDALRLRDWQRSLGYVPQDILILDDSLARNVAFGVPDEEIDQAALERACSQANLGHFIQGLPAGYETILGERGMRLSGGQRQRVGIARSLYRNPPVLIFDEATSSLDGETEAAVMEAIKSLAHQRTIVMIAHRVSTLVDCDVIYMLEEGGLIAASGTYQGLMENPDFCRLARLQEPVAP